MRYAHVTVCLQLLAVSILAGCSVSATRSDSDPQQLQEQLQTTVDAYVSAVGSRELAGIEATITSHDDLPLIFPDGTSYSTRQEYVDFHREWFADPDWTMEMEPVSLTVRDGLGIALMHTTYTDAAGPRQALLTLTFARESGEWRLVFDQNTRIVEP